MIQGLNIKFFNKVMISIKKKIKQYYLIIKNKYFSSEGFCLLSIIVIIQIFSHYTSNMLKVFLMVSYSIPIDSYLLQGS